jgi:hypothetical protein
VEDERKLLNEPRSLAFYHSVAQQLFTSNRARKDIQNTVAFLTMRIRETDEDN